MFKAYVQKYRRYQLMKALEANNRSHLLYLGDCSERTVFDIINGELAYWDATNLTIGTVADCELPPMSQFNKMSRKHADCCVGRITLLVIDLLEKKYSPQAGVKILEINGIAWYVSPLSLLHDDKVVLMSPDRETMFVPKAVLSSLPFRTIGELHPYVANPIDLCCGGAYSGAKPVIQVVELPNNTKEAAITYRRKIPGAPGLYDHVACDFIIDVAQLDNSSQPVIDVAEFCRIYGSSEDCPQSYNVDVSRIKLRLGMFPQPIEVRRLKDEVGEHRVIFSGDPSTDYSGAVYINADTLPTSYP